MKRLLFLGGFALLLIGCVRESTLPPDDVMRRAAMASSALESARILGTVKLSGSSTAPTPRTWNATLQVEGISQQTGQQTHMKTTVDATINEAGTEHHIDGVIEMLLLLKNEVLLHIESLTIDPPHPLFNQDAIARMQGEWWELPRAGPSASVTPDPSLLRLQANIITVTQDRGMLRAGGKDSYHYNVTVDKDKLLQYMRSMAVERHQPFAEEEARTFLASFEATGELWIDAETFHIRRILWAIHPSGVESEKKLSISIDLALMDHNAAESIAAPPDVRVFAPGMVLPGADAGTLFP